MSSDDHLRPRFHRGVTFFLALLLSLSVCFMGSGLSLRGALVLRHPAETAREHFERTIELEDALRDEPAWKSRALALFLGRVRPALAEAIDAYDEVVELQAGVLRDAKDAPKSEPGDASQDAPNDATTAPKKDAPGDESARDAKDASTASTSAQDGSATPSTGDGATKPASGGAFGCSPAPTTAPTFPPKDARPDLVELLARRAILQGEAERVDDVMLTVVRVENLGLVDAARAIRYAYQRLEPRERARFADFDLSALKPGWARDRLELRLAQRTGDAERVSALESELGRRADELRSRASGLAWTLIAAVGLGLLVLLAWLAGNRPELPRSSGSVPPEWTFEDGLAVLLRSLVVGFVLVLGVEIGLGERLPDWSVVVTSLVAPIPLFFLVHRGLIAPRVLSIVRVLGLDSFPGGVWKWIAVVLALFAADQLGQALVLELCGRVGLGLHWTEPVAEPLLSMSTLAFAATVVVGIAWDPFVMELTRRGILFLTLRARMPATSAALWSAALVAAFHNGSVPTFLMLTWSGWLFAWTFEATRSLLPGIVVQVLGIGGVLAAVAGLYR